MSNKLKNPEHSNENELTPKNSTPECNRQKVIKGSNIIEILTLNKVEVDLGYFSEIGYFYDKDCKNYVGFDDYDKFGLITRKKINIKKLIKNHSSWNSIDEFLKEMKSQSQFNLEIQSMSKNFLEDSLRNLSTGEFFLGNFEYDIIINGFHTTL
jgi:hypothetical protein